MADSEPKIQSEMANEEKLRLKYLEFVQLAVLHTILYFSNLFDYAKKNSGPLKLGIETVEEKVKIVVGPVYDKYHDVPIEVLKFVDHKVDESLDKVTTHVKQVSAQAIFITQNAPTIARTIVSMDTATWAITSIYDKYEPMAEQCAVSTWHKLNTLPLFPKVAQVVVPKVVFCSEKYNQTVRSTAEMGFKVSKYLPLVPIKRIAKIFTEESSVVVL